MRNFLRKSFATAVIFVLPIALAGGIVWHGGVASAAKIAVPIAALYCWTLLLILLALWNDGVLQLFDKIFPEDVREAR